MGNTDAICEKTVLPRRSKLAKFAFSAWETHFLLFFSYPHHPSQPLFYNVHGYVPELWNAGDVNLTWVSFSFYLEKITSTEFLTLFWLFCCPMSDGSEPVVI